MLQGVQQVGKTTLINRLLASHPDWNVQGFRTYTDFGAMEGTIGPVFIAPAHHCGWYKREEAMVGIRKVGQRITFPEVFDRVGVRILQSAQDADLLLLDEIGTMEEEARAFQRAVLRAFAGQTPIIGVMKPRPSPFMDAVRSQASVKILEITEENRARMLILADQLVSEAVRRWQSQRKQTAAGS